MMYGIQVMMGAGWIWITDLNVRGKLLLFDSVEEAESYANPLWEYYEVHSLTDKQLNFIEGENCDDWL